MNTLKNAIASLAAVLTAILFVAPAFAQESTPGAASAASPATGPMNEDMMAKMMELAKLNENHKLLASLDGTWNYTVKFWMNGDPTSKPDEAKGTAIRKSVMGDRYVMMDVKSKMEMPGADGKMEQFEFMGHSTEGYDNVKKKFVSTWIDNMGTGIMMLDGTYDEASKTFTYTGEYEPMPGMKQQVREVLKLDDKNHMTFEYYENRGGKEVKTMEINYTRKK